MQAQKRPRTARGGCLAIRPARSAARTQQAGPTRYRPCPAPREVRRALDLLTVLRARNELTGLQTFFRPTVPQLRVEVDKEKALALGVAATDVFSALQAQMGSLYVNDFNKSGRTYRVTMQVDAKFRARPEDIGAIHVRSATTGAMVPLKAMITVSSVIGPEQVERYNSYVAAKILGSAKAGFSSGEAIKAVEDAARLSLPPGYDIEWTAQAFQEKRTGNASVFAFGFALIMVYLILAAKNAILIAEFAMQGMEQGKSAAVAAAEAARLRFRPIVMTSLAFVLGVVPLVIATGAGAAARQSMGTGVFGGMLVATFVAPIFVPLFFPLLARKPRPQHAHGTDTVRGGPTDVAV
ncbi:MAG: efflux RND transporter permease subunit [Rhodoferax sp.]|nr:efflux RND transporter permease subunit [Rhodoferax sp.]